MRRIPFTVSALVQGNKAAKKSGAGAGAAAAGECKAADKKDSGEWLKARHADRKSNVKTVFDAIDADKSGDIVKEEMARFAARIKQDDALNKLMAMADSNTDGRVTLDEFTQVLWLLFCQMSCSTSSPVCARETHSSCRTYCCLRLPRWTRTATR
jgi:disulfide oxidoreductase YuzD